MSHIDEAIDAVRDQHDMRGGEARDIVGTLDALGLVTLDENEKHFRHYALKLQNQLDKVRAVVTRLERYAKSAMDDGDQDRWMAYSESIGQLQRALGEEVPS